MSTKEIIKEISRLSLSERLYVVERTLRTIRAKTGWQLEKAATVLQGFYKEDKELTAFTSLDSENFHETR
jgi:hypothetical protein